jgi:hypothetical protein
VTRGFDRLFIDVTAAALVGEVSKSSSLSLKVPATPVRRCLLEEGGGLGLAADVGGDLRARFAAAPPYVVVFLLGVAFLPPEDAPPLSPPPPLGRTASALSSSLHCDECRLWSSSDKLKLDSSEESSASFSLSLSESLSANFVAGLFAIVPTLLN